MMSLHMNALDFLKKFAVSFLIFGSIAAVSSIFWTNDTAYSKQDLASMHFGFPLDFLVADQSRYDPPYPYTMKYCGPWTCPATTAWIPLAVNVLFFASIFAALSFLFFSYVPSTMPLARSLTPWYVAVAVGGLIVVLMVALWVFASIISPPISVVQVETSQGTER